MTHEELNQYMQGAAKAASDALPKGCGFILLAFEFGDSDAFAYITNTQMQDAISTMKEWVQHMEDAYRPQLPPIFSGKGKVK